MKISLELEQEWGTAEELTDYLALLARTLQGLCEMKAGTPIDWFIDVEPDHDVNRIFLTHL